MGLYSHLYALELTPSPVSVYRAFGTSRKVTSECTSPPVPGTLYIKDSEK